VELREVDADGDIAIGPGQQAFVDPRDGFGRTTHGAGDPDSLFAGGFDSEFVDGTDAQCRPLFEKGLRLRV
jgi:hypothetical protein